MEHKSLLLVVLQGGEGDLDEAQTVEEELQEMRACFDPWQIHVNGQEILSVAWKFRDRFAIDVGGIGIGTDHAVCTVAQ